MWLWFLKTNHFSRLQMSWAMTEIIFLYVIVCFLLYYDRSVSWLCVCVGSLMFVLIFICVSLHSCLFKPRTFPLFCTSKIVTLVWKRSCSCLTFITYLTPTPCFLFALFCLLSNSKNNNNTHKLLQSRFTERD